MILVTTVQEDEVLIRQCLIIDFQWIIEEEDHLHRRHLLHHRLLE
jgi:hypothetical protein